MGWAGCAVTPDILRGNNVPICPHTSCGRVHESWSYLCQVTSIVLQPNQPVYKKTFHSKRTQPKRNLQRIIWKKENSYTRKLSKKFRAPGENRTHDPPSSSSDALTTDLLEALWRTGCIRADAW